MGIPLTWWFPVNNSWKIKGNLFIFCLVLSNNHNYFLNKTTQRPLDVLVTFKALPNYIFPTTISRQQEKNHVLVLMSHTHPQGPTSPLPGTSSGIFEKKISFLMFFVTIFTFHSFLPWLVGQCQHRPSGCIFVEHFEEKRCHSTITGMFQISWTFLNKPLSCSLQVFSVIQ